VSSTEGEGNPFPRGYTPPKQPGREINLGMDEVIKKLDDIAVANQRIADSLSGPNAAMQSFRSDTKRRDQYIQRSNQRRDDYEQQAAASEQELARIRNETAQRDVMLSRNAGKLKAEAERYEQGTPTERLGMLDRYGLVTGTGANTQIAGQFKVSDVQAAFEAERSGSPNARSQNILNTIHSQILQGMQATIAREAPSSAERILDAIEESGIKQLRYGQLPLQDLLRSAGTLAGQYYQRTTNRAMDAYDRVQRAHELGIEPAEGDVRLAERAGRFLQTGRSSELGGLAGISGSAARFLPVVGQVASVATIARDIVQNQILNRYQGANRLGQITGQGFSAGVRANIQSTLMGLNPFDMISGEMAKQIVTGVRQQGFSGGQASNVQNAVVGTVNDLGTSVDSTIQLYTDAVRRSGISVDEARKRFETFDDAANQLSKSVQDYTDQFLASSNSLTAAGAGTAAPAVAQALVNATPPGVRDTGIMQTLFERARGEIAAGMGVPPQLVTSQRYARTAYGPGLQAALERNINLARNIVGNDPNAMATYLSQQTGGYFAGMDVGDIQLVLNNLTRGKGPSQQLELQQATQKYNAQLGSVRGSKRVDQSYLDIAKGLYVPSLHGDDELRDYARQRYGISLDQAKEILGKPGSHKKISVLPDTSDLPSSQLKSLRQAAYGSIINSLTDTNEREKIMSHLGDSDFDVAKELQTATNKTGRKVGPTIDMATNAGSVIIRLKPGMESKLFELAKEREQAIASGLVPSNTLPLRP
jgi:hypothetical protein